MEVEISLSIVSWNFHFCDFKFSLHLSNSIYQLFCSDTHSFSVCLSLLLSQNFPKLTTNSCKVLVLENMDVLRTISSQVKYYHKFFFFFCFTKNSCELYYSYGTNSTWHLLCEMYVAHLIRLFFPVSYIDSLPFVFLLLQNFPQSCIRSIWKFLLLPPIGQPECLMNNFFSNYIYYPKVFFPFVYWSY